MDLAEILELFSTFAGALADIGSYYSGLGDFLSGIGAFAEGTSGSIALLSDKG